MAAKDGSQETLVDNLALVYFSSPSENILTLWQFLKFYYFKLQIRLPGNLTLPYITNIEPLSLTLPGGYQRLPSGALKLKFQHVVPDVLIKKLPKKS